MSRAPSYRMIADQSKEYYLNGVVTGWALVSPDGDLKGVSQRRYELSGQFNERLWRKLYDQGWRIEPVTIGASLLVGGLRGN